MPNNNNTYDLFPSATTPGENRYYQRLNADMNTPAYRNQQRQFMPTPSADHRAEDGRIIYGAYGSNLHLDQMAVRCPMAQALGTVYTARGWRLIFRGVADIKPCRGASVPLGAWAITDACLAALDRYEGALPDDRGMYKRVWLRLPQRMARKLSAGVMLVYQMNSGAVYPPASGYLNTIWGGYADWDIDPTVLTDALEHSFTHSRA